MQRINPVASAGLLLSVLGSLAAEPATGQYVWNAGTGLWTTPGNWTPAGPPAGNEDAEINNGGLAQLSTTGAAHELSLSCANGNVGNLLVHGSGELAAALIDVGRAGSGHLNIESGEISSGLIAVAIESSAGPSDVTVTGNGSTLMASNSTAYAVIVGYRSEGVVNVNSFGNITTFIGGTVIGYFDKGTVNVSSEGTINSPGTILGSEGPD